MFYPIYAEMSLDSLNLMMTWIVDSEIPKSLSILW